MRKKRRIRQWGLGGELPEYGFADHVRVTLYGKRCAQIEGHRGLIEMGADCVRFSSACGVIGVYGTSLAISELSLDAAMVTGEAIESIAYGEGLRKGGNARGDAP